MQTEPATPQVDQPTSLPEILTGDPRVLKGIEELKARYEFTDVSLLYDSTVDPFTADGLLNKVVAKPHVAIVIFTSKGDIFGFFYIEPIQPGKRHGLVHVRAFSFECHGRCETPKFFSPNRDRCGGVQLIFSSDRDGIFTLSVRFSGSLTIANDHSRSFGNSLSTAFEDMPETLLTGKGSGEKFTCTRLVALKLVI